MAQDDQDDNDNSAPSAVLNTAESWVTGIPAPLRKSAFKAVSQLVGAAADIPTAWFEGRAAEIRATTKARLTLIEESGTKIRNGMQPSDRFAEAAGEQFASRIVREQKNLNSIAATAVQQLGSSSADQRSSDTASDLISDDWLNSFSSVAKDMSSEKMQSLFARILAGEITKPNSFSLKTVHAVAHMSPSAAALFQKLCSLAIAVKTSDRITVEVRVVNVTDGSPGENALAPYGLSFSALNILAENGLIINELNSYREYKGSIVRNNRAQSFEFQGKEYVLIQADTNSPIPEEFHISGVALSGSGRELYNIVDFIPQEDYEDALKKHFRARGMDLLEIKRDNLGL